MRQFEITFLPGLGQFVLEEVDELLNEDNYKLIAEYEDHIVINTEVSRDKLSQLRLATSAYHILSFDIPRPKALLGQQNFSLIVHSIKNLTEEISFSSFRINAAGQASSTMQRIIQNLEESLSLPYDHEDGELEIRIKKEKQNWQVLLRISPRPLSARDWRVSDMPGALNACIAACMIRLISPAAGILCNLTSGSGSLLIEAHGLSPRLNLLGIDLDERANNYALKNLAKANCKATIIKANAGSTPLKSKSLDYVVSDLPWGERIGSRKNNSQLYSDILRETYRILNQSGEAVFLTQHVEALDQALASISGLIEIRRFKVFQKGFYPTILWLRKN